MICYKDATFCDFLDCCFAHECRRALNDKIKEDAEKVGLPIAQFTSQPGCYIKSIKEN